MSKRIKINYRKICQEYYNYSDEQMLGNDVHHIDGNRNNNDPKNLMLVTPKQHAKIHEHEFVLWARKGSKAGNQAFIKRLNEFGPTDKELAHREKMKTILKRGIHRCEHTEETKSRISANKKQLFLDKTKHPLWGKTTYEVISPNGEVFVVSGGWKQWCFDRGLNPSNLKKVADGKRNHCKGWKARIIDV